MCDFTKEVCEKIGSREGLNEIESEFVTDWLVFWLNPENDRKSIVHFMDEEQNKKYVGNINSNVLSFAKYCFDSVPFIRKSFFEPMTIKEIVDYVFDAPQKIHHLGFDMIYHLSVNAHGCCYFTASKIISSKLLAHVKEGTPEGTAYYFYAFNKNGNIYFPPYMKKEEGFRTKTN